MNFTPASDSVNIVSDYPNRPKDSLNTQPRRVSNPIIMKERCMHCSPKNTYYGYKRKFIKNDINGKFTCCFCGNINNEVNI